MNQYQSDFIKDLQNTAKDQAQLAKNSLLPRSISNFSIFVFDHSFYFILISSFSLALATTIIL